MAKRNKKYSKGYSKRYAKGKQSASEIKKFAYRLGQVYRGLKNPDSAISYSYSRGEKEPVYNNKRSLF